MQRTSGRGLYTKVPKEDFDPPLDDGISGYVITLREHGIETVESCQGGSGHCFPQPTVRFCGDEAAGWKALAVALTFGPMPVAELRRAWSIDKGGVPNGPYWEMTFRG